MLEKLTRELVPLIKEVGIKLATFQQQFQAFLSSASGINWLTGVPPRLGQENQFTTPQGATQLQRNNIMQSPRGQ